MEPARKSARLGRKQNASILDSVTQEICVSSRGRWAQVTGSGWIRILKTFARSSGASRIATERSIQEPSEEIPFGLPENKHVHYRLMYDLLALAFEGDLTRSATYMLGKDLSGSSFPESGFNGAMARLLASWRQARERGQLRQDEPLSRAESGVFRRETGQDSRWRRHPPRSHPDLQGKQHG